MLFLNVDHVVSKDIQTFWTSGSKFFFEKISNVFATVPF